MASMILELTRTNGSKVSIVGGAIVSCEDSYSKEDGYCTIIVTSGEEGDVYHVKESRSEVEYRLNAYLDNMIRERLRVMETNPEWVRLFRSGLSVLQNMNYDGYYNKENMKKEVLELYKKLAAEYQVKRFKFDDRYVIDPKLKKGV